MARIAGAAALGIPPASQVNRDTSTICAGRFPVSRRCRPAASSLEGAAAWLRAGAAAASVGECRCSATPCVAATLVRCATGQRHSDRSASR